MNILYNILYMIYVYYTLATPWLHPLARRGPGAPGPGITRDIVPALRDMIFAACNLYKAQCLGLEKALRNEANISFIRGNISLKGVIIRIN